MSVTQRLTDRQIAEAHAEKLRKEKETIQAEWRDKSQQTGGVVDEEVIAEVKQKVLALCARYPVYQQAAS